MKAWKVAPKLEILFFPGNTENNYITKARERRRPSRGEGVGDFSIFGFRIMQSGAFSGEIFSFYLVRIWIKMIPYLA